MLLGDVMSLFYVVFRPPVRKPILHKANYKLDQPVNSVISKGQKGMISAFCLVTVVTLIWYTLFIGKSCENGGPPAGYIS
jgi:hypothetical protein